MFALGSESEQAHTLQVLIKILLELKSSTFLFVVGRAQFGLCHLLQGKGVYFCKQHPCTSPSITTPTTCKDDQMSPVCAFVGFGRIWSDPCGVNLIYPPSFTRARKPHLPVIIYATKHIYKHIKHGCNTNIQRKLTAQLTTTTICQKTTTNFLGG